MQHDTVVVSLLSVYNLEIKMQFCSDTVKYYCMMRGAAMSRERKMIISLFQLIYFEESEVQFLKF